MRYFIIAGEQSGDLHGSNLIKALINADPEPIITCWGGDQMESAGAELLVHYKALAFMGITAVIKNLGAITRNFRLCKQHIKEFMPDVVIFIDYPGFNLRMAEWAKKERYTTFYYISPKFWAWKENRIRKVKMYIDRMFIIFPFEVEFYKRHGIDVEYRGNPIVDETENRISQFTDKSSMFGILGVDNKPVIALLAGSRKHEIELILPLMIEITEYFPEYQFILAGVRNIPDELYRNIIGNKPVKLIKEKTYEILYIAEAAVVTSGTATLETALHNTPQVVCYKGDFLTMLIAWFLIKVKYISLVNLVMGYESVRELVQYDLTKNSLIEELKAILPGGSKREKLLSDYMILKEKLGSAGASERVAREIIRDLKERWAE